ncbi:hypothetical protein [Haliangium sp. UPWRP_2]|uniref:hypothetical protein n=1 Tax=Haliangium sp. UPWRP_2 TaxID=1931276 RepID=UPI00130488BF|nr:hypothetical protein [Haliangium sp. UPWRP_2]
MDKPPRADIRGIRSGLNLVQPAQARNYAQHLRDLAAIQWDAAADLCERLRAEAPTGPVDKGPIPPAAPTARSPEAAASTPPAPPELDTSCWRRSEPAAIW